MLRFIYFVTSVILACYLCSNCTMQTSKQKFHLLEDEVLIEEVEPEIIPARAIKDKELLQLLDRMKTSSNRMNEESLDLSISPIDVQSNGELIRFNLSNTDYRPLILVDP